MKQAGGEEGESKKGTDSKKSRGEWYDRRRRGVKWSEERGKRDEIVGGRKMRKWRWRLERSRDMKEERREWSGIRAGKVLDFIYLLCVLALPR